jgi:trans-aconitate methyltransferase
MWVENFFNKDYEIFLKKDEKELELIEKKLSYFINFNDLNSVIEQCCGNGVVLSYLNKKYPHLNLEGFDIINDYVINKNRQINLFQSDVLKYNNNNKYDLVMNIGNSFGYFNKENNLNVIKNASFMSNKFLLQISNFSNVKKNFKSEFYFHDVKRICKLEKNIMYQTWIYPNGNEYKSVYEYYELNEILEMLLKYFKNVEFCDENKNKITDNSKEIIFLAKK